MGDPGFDAAGPWTESDAAEYARAARERMESQVGIRLEDEYSRAAES